MPLVSCARKLLTLPSTLIGTLCSAARRVVPVSVITHPAFCVSCRPAKEAFRENVSKGLPVEAKLYRDQLQSFVDACDPCWAGNFLLGFLNACCSFEDTAKVRRRRFSALLAIYVHTTTQNRTHISML